MKIIFICKYNAFRSRIAEEYFNKINKNKNIEVISGGLILSGGADEEQKRLAKLLLDIDIDKRKPLSIKIKDLIDADLIVVVADDIPKIIFNYKLVPIKDKIVFWKIKDEQERNLENIKDIILKIKKKVDDLNRKLEKNEHRNSQRI
jgi:protein-tyrosine-phosphatase